MFSTSDKCNICQIELKSHMCQSNEHINARQYSKRNSLH